MRIVEVRRHAERADRADEESALSERGRAMCAAIAARSVLYALVVSSPSPRARETADLIGGRLDRVEKTLLPDLKGLPFGFWEGIDDIAGYVELLRTRSGARGIADEQADLWVRLAGEVRDGERVLAISHGAVVELGAIAIAERIGKTLAGPTFGLCEGVVVAFDGAVPAWIEQVREGQDRS